MITAEEIKRVNETVKKIELKGKKYVCVFARVAAFRELCPEGTITTDIIEMRDGIVTMKATVMDEAGKILSTGMAQEKETSSYVNKTSYIENCETSAVGRALGMLGIGTDEGMASAEEVANAINQQAEIKSKETTPDEIINDNEQITLENLAQKAGLRLAEIEGWPKITKARYAYLMQQCRLKLEKANENKGKDK